MNKRIKLGNLPIYLALGIGAITMLFPFVWMILTAFKTNAEAMQIPPVIFPSEWNLDAFKQAMESLPFGKLYINTGLMIFSVSYVLLYSARWPDMRLQRLNFPSKRYCSVWY